MPSRFLAILACAGVPALLLAGYLVWRNAPVQAAKRYLDKLARTATVYPEDSALNRRFRPSQFEPMLADHLEIHLPESQVSGSLEMEQLLAGYLSLVAEASYFQVTFTEVKIARQSPGEWIVQARLTVRCDEAVERFPADQPVDLAIRPQGNGFRLVSIRARTVAAGS